MFTNAERLKIVQDMIDRGNPAFGITYECSLRVNKQNEDGTIDISLINDEGEPESGATVRVYDGTPVMLSVDLGPDALGGKNVRLIDTTPHTLFAILYV
jgi:hypothetical protein